MKKLKLKYFVLFVVLISFSALTPVGTVNAENVDFFEQQKMTSYMLINLFMDQVGQEGLSLFDDKVKKAELHSPHVASVHHTANDTLQVELCFTITKRILVPDFESFYVEKITVEMDQDGNIIEILTHVSQLDKE